MLLSTKGLNNFIVIYFQNFKSLAWMLRASIIFLKLCCDFIPFTLFHTFPIIITMCESDLPYKDVAKSVSFGITLLNPNLGFPN